MRNIFIVLGYHVFMHVTKIYEEKKFVLSFELMPPRNGQDINKLFGKIENFMQFKPDFFTFTQSSSDSLRTGTDVLASLFQRKYDIEVMSHFICANKTNSDVENELTNLNYLDVENIMALRGDPPWGEKEFKTVDKGFSNAYQLVEEIQKKNRGEYILRGNDKEFFKLEEDAKFRQGTKTNFCVGVAGYPEGHRNCKDKLKNIQYLKQKVDAGANIIFTQMFYDAKYYFDFVKDCRNAGINVPIVPGIMPISFSGQIKFLKDTCAVTIPQDYLECLEKNKDNKEKFLECSVKFISKLCNKLKEKGVPGLHFYTLNNWKIINNVLRNLGV